MSVKTSQESVNTLSEVKNIITAKSGVVVLDFDGVVADTEPLHLQAYVELLKKYNVQFLYQDFRRYIGHSEEEIYKLLEQDYSIDMNPVKDKAFRLNNFMNLVIKEKLQLSRVAQAILDTDSEIFILSSQDQATIKGLLKYWNIGNRFSFIKFTSHLPGKREVVSVLASFIGTEPAKVFHFEDNSEIIKSSKTAGHKTIFVRHSLNQEEQSNADWTVDI